MPSASSALPPNDTVNYQYELRFRAPGAGANTAPLGTASSPFTNALQRISDIVVPPDTTVADLNLPIDPNGVVYNSVSRTPVAGATLTLLNAGSGAPLPDGCFYDASQQGQVTLADGYYKFDLNFSDAACPSGANYLVGVEVPAGTIYVAGYSQVIPPASDASTAAFSVPACPGSADDVIPGTALFCEVQGSEFAPAASVPARTAGTVYHVHLTLDNSQVPGSAQIFNNHIPLDPELSGALAITKTTPLRNVTRGQLVPYVITVSNTVTAAAHGRRDRRPLPGGFPLRRGVGTHRRSRRRAGARGPRADLGWTDDRGYGAAHPEAPARRGRGRRRGRVRQPRPGRSRHHGQRDVRRGHRDGARRARPDVRLHGRDRQGVRRRQPERPAGGRRDRPAGRAGRDGARPGGDHRPVRPLPHHLRGHARRAPRQQLRREARRPHAAERLPPVGRPGADQACHARQGAAVQLRRVDPPRRRLRAGGRRVRAGQHRDPHPVAAAHQPAASRSS